MAQGGGKPTLLCQWSCEERVGKQTINKDAHKSPRPSLEMSKKWDKNLKQANPKLTRGR